MWDTYSAFANCYGGVSILGVKEDKDGNWLTTGLKNAAKLKKDFWDTLNNRKKVSIDLLKDGDVEAFSAAGTDDVIMVIWVPSAKRELKPVYINVIGAAGLSKEDKRLHSTAEHAGSGVPNIFNVWEDEGWEEPVITECFDPDRTSLTLKFVKKQAIKTGQNRKEIRLYLQKCETAKTSDIAELLGLSMARTRAILSEMDDVETLGTNRTNRTRRYRLREKGE